MPSFNISTLPGAVLSPPEEPRPTGVIQLPDSVLPCCQVVEIGQPLRTLFCAQVWENGYAGHGFGRRYRFLSARIIFASVIIIAGDDDRFVWVPLTQRRGDRKKVP